MTKTKRGLANSFANPLYMEKYECRLEAYVSTESDGVGDVKTERVSLHVALLAKLPTEVAYVCNEAHFVRKTVCDTGLYGNLPKVHVVLHTACVNIAITETTVNESREVAALEVSVTSVRVESETVRVSTTLHVSVRILESHGDVPVVVEFVTNFRGDSHIVALVELGTIQSGLRSVETNFATNPNLCVCCERCNCNECSKNNLFHKILN